MKNFLSTLFIALAVSSAIIAKAQVPALNSYPSASTVIFLDFDGHTLPVGNAWNYTSSPMVMGSSGLTTSQITDAFNRIAEDYRPFNINVTTEEAKYLAAAATKRMRVILTTSWEWYGSAGGVAFVGSFIWGDNTPCFVFSSLLNYNVKNISEAAAHEAGHTLGLYHQSTYDANCVKISDYNYGFGSGEIGWAPIMGVGYYKNNTTWFNGPNSYGCNNYQNDLTVLLSNNGVTYRPDDFGEAFSSAAAQTFTTDQFTVPALISTPTDKDIFKFTLTSTKRIKMNAIPTNAGSGNVGSNLDIWMQLSTGNNAVIGTYNPPLALNAYIDTILNPGTYYILIDGVSNQYTPEYGSLGGYQITANRSDPITLALRKLELSGEATGDKHRLNWLIDADEQVVSQVLEVATDGRNFSPVTTPFTADRQFMYRPYVSTAAQYRLNVTFDNGKQYYSNIVTLRGNGSVVRPKIVNNLINNSLITVNSPGNYNYIILDMNSKVTHRGQLKAGLNNIIADRIAGGVYMIQYSNGVEQWTDKFIRQ
ncbi:MAG: zinc-dependent metalloprotease family protein [Chitinophagaceae bacterium]